jgi:hypothetical protein
VVGQKSRAAIAVAIAGLAIVGCVLLDVWPVAVAPLALGAFGYWWSRRRGESSEEALTLAGLYVIALTVVLLALVVVTAPGI